jgi:hypothetical protein
MVKRQVDGQPQTRRFAVPVLDVEVSPGELMAGAQATPQLDAQAAKQVDGTARLTPVPAALSSGPITSVREQAGAVDEQQQRPPRRNAAQPLPSTGLQPRTAQQAQGDEPAFEGITSAQLKKLGALMREADITERSVALTYVSDVIGRQVASRNELTKHEASQVIDALEAEKATDGDEPAFDDNPGFVDQKPLT